MNGTGERDPAKVAALRDRRCLSPLPTIKDALSGRYLKQYLFVLRQSQSTWQRVANALGEGVFGLHRSQNRMGEYTRRMKRRLGQAEGITIGARKLALVVYALIATRHAYVEAKPSKSPPVPGSASTTNFSNQPNPWVYNSFLLSNL